MKDRFWAVILEGIKQNEDGFCFTWDKKHPRDKRNEKSVQVWAIYPRKKDALADAKFRGCSYVKEVTIGVLGWKPK